MLRRITKEELRAFKSNLSKTLELEIKDYEIILLRKDELMFERECIYFELLIIASLKHLISLIDKHLKYYDRLNKDIDEKLLFKLDTAEDEIWKNQKNLIYGIERCNSCPEFLLQIDYTPHPELFDMYH